jgi:hypothetical protein
VFWIRFIPNLQNQTKIAKPNKDFKTEYNFTPFSKKKISLNVIFRQKRGETCKNTPISAATLDFFKNLFFSQNLRLANTK